MIYRWLRADQEVTGEVGWTANLAIFRIVYLYAAIVPVAVDRIRWTRARMPLLPVGAWQPIAFYRWIPLDLLRNASFAHGLAVVDLWLIVLALVGFYTRATLGAATILSTYLFGLTENLGKVDHFHHDVWFMALLAAGPSGDMISIDAILGAIRRARLGRVNLETSRHAALSTLRYIWLLIGVLYLSAGLGKLLAAWDSDWLGVGNLQNIMRRNWLVRRLYGRHFSIAFRLDNLPPALIQICGLGTIAFETSAFGLVLFRASRWLVIFCGLAFHLSNGIVLGIWFQSLMLAYVSMLDWSWLGRLLLRPAGQKSVTVVYDHSCDFCRRIVAILKTVDICDMLTPVKAEDFGNSWGATYPPPTKEMLARDLYVVGEKSLTAGYDAYVKIAACVPLLWPLALVMRLPLIENIGRRCYREIADSRHCRVRRETGWLPPKFAASKKSVLLSAHVVGIFLLAAESITVALNSGAAFGVLGKASLTPSSRKYLANWKARRWVWPFDQYPTFAYSWDIGSYETWEPRLVYANGAESTIAPEIFARTYGGVSLAEENVQQAVRSDDPVWRRKHALNVAAMLWKNLPASTRSSIVAIRGYESVFSTNPDQTEPTSRKLLDTFPVQELAAEAAGTEGHR